MKENPVGRIERHDGQHKGQCPGDQVRVAGWLEVPVYFLSESAAFFPVNASRRNVLSVDASRFLRGIGF
jgi:hypothetical protein